MKTKKIKIAVAVNGKGCWAASGWNHGGDHDYDSKKQLDEFRGTALDNLDCVYDGWRSSHEHVVWVEVEVPLPEDETVAGSVSHDRDV